MIDPISTATAGLRAAGEAADAAARTIVRAGAPSAFDATPALIDATGRSPEDDLLQGVLDFRAAAEAFRANAKVVHTLDDMERTLLETLR